MESNSQCPYNFIQEGEWNYSFITKHGIVYHAYFIDFSNYHPAFDNVYTFNIEPENEEPHPIDNRIACTITEILKRFFIQKEHFPFCDIYRNTFCALCQVIFIIFDNYKSFLRN